MAYLELQLAQSVFAEAILAQITPTIYSQFFASPSPSLLLDHVAIASIGPVVVAASGIGLTIPIALAAVVVNKADVIAANGQAAQPIASPQIILHFSMTMKQFEVTIAFESVADYSQIYDLLMLNGVSAADAQAACNHLVSQVTNGIGTQSRQQFNLYSALPTLVDGQSFNVTALSADSSCIAFRFETGSDTYNDGLAQFTSGALNDYLQGAGWGAFINGALMVQIANAEIADKMPSLINVSSSWQGGATPTVATTAAMRVHVGFVVHVPLNITTQFSMPEGYDLHTETTYKIASTVAGFIEKAIANSLHFPTSGGLSDDFLIEPVTFAGITLRASQVTGWPDGMFISGNASADAGLAAPVCQVLVAPFELQYIKSCSAMRDRTQQPASADHVQAIATVDVGDAASGQAPIVFGQVLLVSADPQLQFTSLVPSPPQAPATYWNFSIPIAIGDIKSGYKNAPYPCQLLILTSGGARAVNLGAIPTPSIDPASGLVNNVTTVYVQDCHLVDVDPWILATVIFNPKWTPDPGPEGEAERIASIARELAKILVAGGNGEAKVLAVGGQQVGSIAMGRVVAALGEDEAINSAAIERQVVSTFSKAARLQPPAIRAAAGGTVIK